MLDANNIKLAPSDEEIVLTLASYTNEVVARILKRIDHTPGKEQTLKGIPHLKPSEIYETSHFNFKGFWASAQMSRCRWLPRRISD